MIYTNDKKGFEYEGLHGMMYAKKEVEKHFNNLRFGRCR